MRYPDSPIEGRYNKLATERSPYLTRGYQFAEWTIPALLPPNDDNRGDDVPDDYQSIGARGVNHLANKYMNAQYPAGRPFIRLEMKEPAKASLLEQGHTEEDIEYALANIERQHVKRLESDGARAPLIEARKHLIVTGNCLLYLPKDGNLQVFALDQYVVKRSAKGVVLEIITKEAISWEELPGQIQLGLLRKDPGKYNDPDATTYIYTQIKMHKGKYTVIQAVDGMHIPGVYGRMDADQLRWIPLTWNRFRREHYGRGLVEDHRGDFHGLSVLNQALVEGCIAAADLKRLVKPDSVVNPVDLNDSPSGSYHYGEPEDITTVQLNKQSDFAMIEKAIERLERNLGTVFLLNSAVTRDAERVTAEELRMQARELETSHGGIFSSLSLMEQLPLAKLYLLRIDMRIGKEAIEPVVITGIDAMSRDSDLEAMHLWLQDLKTLNDLPEEVRGRMKLSSLMTTMATGRGVEFKPVVKSDDEYAAEQDAMRQAQQEDMVSAEVAKAAPKVIEKQATGQ